MTGDAGHPEGPRLNYSDLIARMENDRALVCDLLQIFKDEFPRELRSLQEAVACGDMKTVKRLGHTLKGMLLMLTFGRAAHAARQIEALGEQGTLERIPELLAGLEHEAGLAAAELESCIGLPQ